MNILITALELGTYSGLPLYTRDIALELKRQGHNLEVYTLRKGAIATELLAAGIPVEDNPGRIKMRPDIIHGQHRVSTLIAIKQFRAVPALFICHNHTFWGDRAPRHPRILLYLGVSRVCMERLRQDGVPEERILFSANFVDTKRFLPRAALPGKPRKALVFSNYATEQTHLPAVREACRRAGLDLDTVGALTNYLSSPENVLGKYDLVFAKARAAIEAMATGAAVILCDYSGVGPMVASAEFDRLRLMNFGFQSLTMPLDADNILPEIARYDSADATKVRDLIRTNASLEKAAREFVSVYERVIDQHHRTKHDRTAQYARVSLRESFYWERARFWATLAQDWENRFDLIRPFDAASKNYTYIVDYNPLEKATWLWDAFKETATKIKLFPVRIWVAIPAHKRAAIKRLPIVRALLGLLKRVFYPSRNEPFA